MTNIDHHGFLVLRKFDSIDYCDFHYHGITISCPTLLTMSFINPQHTCAARVTVLGLCVCVCVSVSTYSRPTGTKLAH